MITLTPEQRTQFETRPKSLKEISEAISRNRGRLLQISISQWPSSHSAPLGVEAKWPGGEALYAFIGQAAFRVDDTCNEQPWKKLWWFHPGCGGASNGGLEYQFVIWQADVPEAASEWRTWIAPSLDAKNSHQALIQSIESEVAKATEQIWKNHKTELQVAEERAAREWSAFEKWKDAQIGS